MISIITPSIRPYGLVPIFETLKEQSYKDWEWLPRLSVPRGTPDLAYQMNQALYEAKGEIIVFVQDWIELHPTSLERIVDLYKTHGETFAFTFPTGKVTSFDQHKSQTKWDWRRLNDGALMQYHMWEIDFGSVSKKLLDLVHAKHGYYFDEGFDKAGGFSGENVEFAWRLREIGANFKCDKANSVLVLDHERIAGHEWREEGNDKNAAYMRECIERQRLDNIKNI